MPYIGKTTDGFGVRNRFVYLASNGATSVSGADANGATLTFTDGAYVDVYLNGVLLKPTTDYNTSTANTIAGLSALNTNDEVTVVVYDIFTVADMVSATSGGTFVGNVNFSGNIDVDGTATLDAVDIDGALTQDGGAVFNEDSADVDFRVESNGESHMLFVDGGNDAVILGHSVKVDGINDDNEGVKGSGGQLQLHGASPVVDFFSYSTTDGTHGGINFMKSANNTIGSTTAVSASDVIGSIAFGGFDGADYASIAGKIDFQMGGSGIGENDTAGEMVFYTTADGSGGGGSNERMRIESDGTVRITSHDLKIGNNASQDSQIQFDSNASDWLIGIDQSDGGFFKFNNSSTMGTSTSMFFGGSNRVNMSSTSTAGRLNLGFTHSTSMVGIDMIPDATTATMIQFKNSGGSVAGSITTGGSSTAFNTSSDYRLKENVNYSWDATSRLKQLKPARFNFKADADTTVDGFLAHEVSSIVPEAIFGIKDETRDIGDVKDKDGNIVEKDIIEAQAKKDEGYTWTKTGTENVYQGIDQSKLVPLLVKTIQELEARVATLEKA